MWSLGAWLFGGLVAFACAVGDETDEATGACVFGPTCITADGGSAGAQAARFDSGGVDPVVDAASAERVLCGAGDCLPDDPNSCTQAPAFRDAGLERDAGDAGGVLSSDAASVGDASLGLDAGTGAEGGDAAEAPGATPGNPDAGDTELNYSCQVTINSGQATPACAPAGVAEEGAACNGLGDCSAGLACVGQSGAGRCLPYCCGGASACTQGSYCAPQPLLPSPQPDQLQPVEQVPVCLPADHCSLAEPSPCEGDQCVCSAGLACTVVRGDGTTSCVDPGRGEAGEACPCAAGYFCASTSQTCLQICETAQAAESSCGAGRCQTAAGFPQGWGLCVGASVEF